MKWTPSVFVLVMAMMMVDQAAHAGELVYRFEGSVVSNSISRSPWNTPGVGDKVFLEFAADTTVPDAFPQHETIGVYFDVVTAFALTIGGESGVGDSGYIQISDEKPGEEADIFSTGGMFLADDFEFISTMFDLSGTAFSSIELPADLTITDWYPAVARLYDREQPGVIDIAWHSVEVIPAPGATALSALAGLFVLRRGRRGNPL